MNFGLYLATRKYNYLKAARYRFLFFFIFIFFKVSAQFDTSVKYIKQPKADHETSIDSSKQRDVIDYIRKVFIKKSNDTVSGKPKKLDFSVVPALGYSLSTGFAVDVTANVGFYTNSNHQQNLSETDVEAVYDTKIQKILISRATIWGTDNDFKFVTDMRLEKYPVSTYGLGAGTTSAKEDPLVYSYIRTYLTAYRKIIPDFYIGLGYNMDYHFNITEAGNADNTVSDFKKYGETSSSTSAGPVINLLFDNRRNPINPLNGGYASILYRDNRTFLGSDNNWTELQFDFRRYFKLSPRSNNVLAFWTVLEFTSGHVPYLDMPATGSDMYNNAGRGYAEQRFRGKNMLYLEGEYRFGISKNGLLGGVLFGNAESFTEFQSNRFEKIAPAVGTGLRVKINKHSNTNVCIDYAYGIYGSRGLFVNLGEVF
jgi:outer membrane protein assembly factor BamA